MIIWPQQIRLSGGADWALPASAILRGRYDAGLQGARCRVSGEKEIRDIDVTGRCRGAAKACSKAEIRERESVPLGLNRLEEPGPVSCRESRMLVGSDCGAASQHRVSATSHGNRRCARETTPEQARDVWYRRAICSLIEQPQFQHKRGKLSASSELLLASPRDNPMYLQSPTPAMLAVLAHHAGRP